MRTLIKLDNLRRTRLHVFSSIRHLKAWVLTNFYFHLADHRILSIPFNRILLLVLKLLGGHRPLELDVLTALASVPWPFSPSLCCFGPSLLL
jgi:hypothetical protein